MAAWGLSLLWAPSAHADRPENDLPRRLAMAEPRRVPTVDVRVEVVLPDLESDNYILATVLHPVAERILSAPNPYQDAEPPPPAEFRFDDSVLQLPQIERERRYFQMEDSGDMMGIRLNQDVMTGLQVEFIGPAEDPRSSRRMVFMKTDPFHQRYLLMTAGMTVRF